MTFDERLGWLLLGCLIGFVLGYITRFLKEIKEELDEVDEMMKRHDEHGYARPYFLMDLLLFGVVLLTVWAAFASQRASNSIEDTQAKLARISYCNQEYLSKTIAALNERTNATQDQVDANVVLERAESMFLRAMILSDVDATAVRGKALHVYSQAVDSFILTSKNAADRIESYPYPTNTELFDCLNQEVKE